DRPGLGQFNIAAAAAGDKIYVLGGCFAPLKPRRKSEDYYNAVDSWVYSVAERKWTRIRDVTHGSSRSPVSYKDRYRRFLSGVTCKRTLRTDGTQLEVTDTEYRFEKTVLVYDARTDRLGTADPLLEQTAWPMVKLIGDRIYCLGGEGGRLHHPP